MALENFHDIQPAFLGKIIRLLQYLLFVTTPTNLITFG